MPSNPKPETRNPKPETLNPNVRQYRLHPKTETLNPQRDRFVTTFTVKMCNNIAAVMDLEHLVVSKMVQVAKP